MVIKDNSMNTKDTTINDSSFKKLLNNDNYYRHIFKKTEKIVSVVFYILNNLDADKKSETLISNIASKAHFAHENALRTLEVKPVSSKEVLEQFAQSLVGLDSTLRIATSANVLTNEVLAVIVGEIDTVLRGLKTYIVNNSSTEELSFMQYNPGGFTSQYQTAPVRPERKKAQNTNAPAQDTTQSASIVSDRRERIKTILEAKGEATIKDISEIITDCSEKTIQRELNTMIEENIVKRQGERRWSKYSIF
jgi:hypothetical protein